jgi:hypothetical protein
MLRLQLPGIIDQSDVILTRPKDDDDLTMGMRDPEFPRNLKKLKNPSISMFRGRILWDQYLQNFNKLPDPDLYPAIRDFLLQKVGPVNEHMLIKYIDESSRDARIRSMTIRLMGTPEYQLC